MMNLLYTARQQELYSAGFQRGTDSTDLAINTGDARDVMQLAEHAARAYEIAHGPASLGSRWERKAFVDGWFYGRVRRDTVDARTRYNER